MEVLALNPPFLPRYSRQSRSPCVTKGGTFYFPYYLAYMVGVLEKDGFQVRLLDAVARNLSHEDTVNIARDFKPDLVVMDTSTPSIYNDAEVGNMIKQALPNAHISLVGTHPSRLPEETFSLSESIDSICRGEYDYTVRDLAHALENGKPLESINGLSYREKGKIKHNKDRELIQNLDELPFVSGIYKKHLNVRDYFYASLTYPQVTILTARGCPYSCDFCNIPFKASYRARSPENVLEEFEYIQRELPEVKEVMVEDDTFTVNRERTLKLCDLLIKNRIKLKWSCNERVNTDLETLIRMKKAGCRLMCIGFESPKQHILDNIHKRTTKKLQLDFMKNARKAGILVNGCFILGLPGDTRESIMETIEFAKELNPDTAQFYPLMVYPGTEAFEWARKMEFLRTEDYSRWIDERGEHATTVNTPGIAEKELVRICNQARKKFYLRSGYIIYKVEQMVANPSEIRRTLKSGKTFFKHLAGRRV